MEASVCCPHEVIISGVKISNLTQSPVDALTLGLPTPGGGSLAQHRALGCLADPTQLFGNSVKYLSADIFGSDFFFPPLFVSERSLSSLAGTAVFQKNETLQSCLLSDLKPAGLWGFLLFHSRKKKKRENKLLLNALKLI